MASGTADPHGVCSDYQTDDYELAKKVMEHIVSLVSRIFLCR